MSEQLDQILETLDESFEADLLKRVPGALLESGDQIYIRKVGQRLQWIKANVHGGGQEWQELTPRISRQIEAMAIGDAQDEIEAAARAKRAAELEKRKAARIGWYQDAKGDLYQFDGTTWLGTIPSIGQIEKLEYLGE